MSRSVSTVSCLAIVVVFSSLMLQDSDGAVMAPTCPSVCLPTTCFSNKGMGTKKMGCHGSRKYVMCTSDKCSTKMCRANEVWNGALSGCQHCPAGMKFVASRNACECVTPGEGYSKKAKKCVACMGGKINIRGECACKAPMYWNWDKLMCMSCPTGSLRSNSEIIGCSCKKPAGSEFYMESHSCICSGGRALNAAGTACTFTPPMPA